MKGNLKERVKKIWREHKTEIIIGGVTIVGAAIGTGIIVSKYKKSKSVNCANTLDEILEVTAIEKEPLDVGRDCLMTFTVEETGEVLGSVKCCESYVKDWVDDGTLAEIITEDYGITQ